MTNAEQIYCGKFCLFVFLISCVSFIALLINLQMRTKTVKRMRIVPAMMMKEDITMMNRVLELLELEVPNVLPLFYLPCLCVLSFVCLIAMITF